MWKTFFITPLAGAIAAILGWMAAIVVRDSMDQAEFASLRFGWSGLMIAGVALAALVIFMVAGDMVEPLVMTASAAVGTGLLWEQYELPFSTTNFEQQGTPYWFAFTMMAVIFVLLLMGLRAARESNNRARG